MLSIALFDVDCSVGLGGHVAATKPLLTAQHRQKRLQFATDHADWSWVDWASVLWTHVSRFTMFQNDGRVFVRRRHHGRFYQDCLALTVKFGGGGIMMWGAMSYRGTEILKKVSGILDAKGYMYQDP